MTVDTAWHQFVDVWSHQAVQESVDGGHRCVVQQGRKKVHHAFRTSAPADVNNALVVALDLFTANGGDALLDAGAEGCRRFPCEGDGDNLSRQQAGPRLRRQTVPWRLEGCTGARSPRAGSRWRQQRRALSARQKMLDVALGHHRGLAGACPSIKDNVAIQIQPEALGVPERVMHQRAPPRKATPQAEALSLIHI